MTDADARLSALLAYPAPPRTDPAFARITVAALDVTDKRAVDDLVAGLESLDVVVTNDIPLADRVLKAGGAAIAPNGRVFTVDSIGSALAGRAIGEHMRSMGEITGGPKAFDRTARSRFLQALDEAVNRERRKRR